MSFQSRKRLLSKMSILGSLGSRMFFHKRGDRLKIPKYQNTYRLEAFRSFNVEAVDELVIETMENRLSSVTAYHPSQSGKLCMDIGADLQKAVSKKDYDRYKIVAQVTIVQRLHQSIHASFQCLWDVERDNYSYYVFENNHIYAWCCVFGLYYE
ncbi:PREDICTED: tctex1 domain-containing protein 1-like [Dufourea novaeangliae]|uniref:Tctex1 domain-containing protein 1 n=1 Tax=Dufourea novaeangliae TaxID=178035 RepID=A0A154PL57_DUFNO|nr:PREDICTED: tctex1 domain-containing protein 1-like [Dufourea novaeangliae]KZC12563.1 Tctex1 domain-containing protein 1 [Dufourea novaeangliae]